MAKERLKLFISRCLPFTVSYQERSVRSANIFISGNTLVNIQSVNYQDAPAPVDHLIGIVGGTLAESLNSRKKIWLLILKIIGR